MSSSKVASASSRRPSASSAVAFDNERFREANTPVAVGGLVGAREDRVGDDDAFRGFAYGGEHSGLFPQRGLDHVLQSRRVGASVTYCEFVPRVDRLVIPAQLLQAMCAVPGYVAHGVNDIGVPCVGPACASRVGDRDGLLPVLQLLQCCCLAGQADHDVYLHVRVIALVKALAKTIGNGYRLGMAIILEQTRCYIPERLGDFHLRIGCGLCAVAIDDLLEGGNGICGP